MTTEYTAAPDAAVTPPDGSAAGVAAGALSPSRAGRDGSPPLLAVVGSRAPTPTTASPRVRGLDLSLTGTGIAGEGWAERIGRKGKRNESLAMRADRLADIADRAWLFCRHAHLVVVESPAYNTPGGSTHDRSGLWWLIVARLRRAGIPVVEVNPSTRLGYATGDGNTRRPGHKAEVVAAVRDWHPWWEGGDDNEADALVLHAMGCAALGRPVVGLAAAHTRFLDTPDWPDLNREVP